jgi:hypothetical protein
MVTRTAASVHFRIYVAAIGATGALLAAAVVIFSLVASSGAFLDGLPFAGSDGASGAYVGSHSQAGMKSVGEPAGAAARGAASHAGAGKPGSLRRPDLRHRNPTGRDGSTGAAPEGSTNSTVTAPTGGGPMPPPAGGPVISPHGGGGSPGGAGAAANAVRKVDQATGQNLSSPTGGTTRQIDQTSNGTLNEAGGAVGQPQLGNHVSHTATHLGGGG